MKHSTSFKQELVGVFGDPVAENPTQAMIEATFAEIGMDWRYLTVEVKAEALGDAVKGARAMNWKGFNCTIPHKVAVVPLLNRLNPAAKIIGAVNCIINRHGELVGDNTDGKGFLQSLAGIHAIRGCARLSWSGGRGTRNRGRAGPCTRVANHDRQPVSGAWRGSGSTAGRSYRSRNIARRVGRQVSDS